MRTALAVLALLAACTAPEPPPAPGRDGLYEQMRACLAQPVPAPPCARVDRARGFVVIKDDDPAKPDAWLIVPATEVTGIEDPRALRPPVAELWAYGWEVAGELLDRPPQAMALAINSKAGRSQDLLHIHISCVLPEVAAGLARAPIGPDWAAAPFVIFDGHPYNARTVATLEPSPFLVLRELPEARADMAAQSLAVIGAADGGFYLLADANGAGFAAEAEELLDQNCGWGASPGRSLHSRAVLSDPPGALADFASPSIFLVKILPPEAPARSAALADQGNRLKLICEAG